MPLGSALGCCQDEQVDPVIVIGAGIAGIAAARTIGAAGLPVVVLERGRNVGGRMAVRTTGERVVDIGASYFTVSDPRFEAVVQDWQRSGLARPWTDTFHLFDAARLSTKSGPMRWSAPTGLRSLVADLAVGVEVRCQQVATVAPGLRVDQLPTAAVVLAMPDPQARRLLHPEFAALAAELDDDFEPALALVAAWSRQCWNEVDGVFVSDDPTLTWVADDGRRRGDQAPVLVAHSTPNFANEHLAEPVQGTGAMLAALQRVLDIDEPPVSTSVHRWSFAHPASTRTSTYLLTEAMVGVCGDAWSNRPRVEAAYLSGVELGEAIADRLG